MRGQRSILIFALAIFMVIGIALNPANAVDETAWVNTWHKININLKAICEVNAIEKLRKTSSKEPAWLFIEAWDGVNKFDAYLVSEDLNEQWQATKIELTLINGTSADALLRSNDFTIIDNVTDDEIEAFFVVQLKGKVKNGELKSGKISNVVGMATLIFDEAECVASMTCTGKLKSVNKVPQEVIGAKNAVSGPPPPPPPPSTDIEIISSYVQYRTYYDPALSRYQGSVEFREYGQPIDESDIVNIILKDSNQNEITIDQIIFYKDEYYFGAWNSVTQQVDYYVGLPGVYCNFSIHFPEETTFSSGSYTYEATTSQGAKISDVRYFPGKLELPVIDSTTMTSEWINGDLKLSWTNPDMGVQADQVRIWLYNEQLNPELPLMIRLPNNATEVTIPAQVINKVKQLSNNVPTMRWLVLLYAIENTTDNSYARSFSERILIPGWSD